MGRIVKFNGVKYEIPDAEFTVPFTDVNGKSYEFDQYAFHNPMCHKAFGFTTILSVLKWWVANREALLPVFEERGLSEFILHKLGVYFDYLDEHDLCNESFEYLKGRLTGLLRTKSLTLVTSGTAARFSSILTEDQSQPQPIKVVLGIMFRARVGVDPIGSNHPAEDIWSKHYNYSFKMNEVEFDWYRSVNNENSVMFGLELEISTELSTHEIQRIVRDVEPKQEPFFIFKQDSSISGRYSNALELVTVPCTPRYLRKNWKIFFQKLDKLCRAKGMVVGDVVDTNGNLSNGLHIHVSRDSFLDKPHFNKFLTAWNQWSKSVVNLFNTIAARPTDYTKNSYCKINQSHEGLVLARRLKGIRCNDRMSVAHDSTGSTVEVRLYQGIFDIAHIMRCISFTEAMFEFSQSMGYSSFDARFVSSMSKFVRAERKYASLYSVFEKAASK